MIKSLNQSIQYSNWVDIESKNILKEPSFETLNEKIRREKYLRNNILTKWLKPQKQAPTWPNVVFLCVCVCVKIGSGHLLQKPCKSYCTISCQYIPFISVHSLTLQKHYHTSGKYKEFPQKCGTMSLLIYLDLHCLLGLFTLKKNLFVEYSTCLVLRQMFIFWICLEPLVNVLCCLATL